MNFISNTIKRISGTKPKPNGELEAQIWEISIVDDFSGFMHNNYYKIKEIYIPELNTSYNNFQRTLNVIVDSASRYDIHSEEENGPAPKLLKKIIISSEEAYKFRLLSVIEQMKHTIDINKIINENV
jgi:hypothetical protein